MNELEDLIKRGMERGNVFLGIPKETEDWDDFFKRIGFKDRSLLVYCTETFLEKTKELLKSVNAGYEGATGLFESKDTGKNYMSEVSFSRGSYQVYLIRKPVSKSVLVEMDEVVESRIIVFDE